MAATRQIRCIAFDYTNTITTTGSRGTVTGAVDPLAADVLHELHRRRFRLVLASNTVPERARDQALVRAGIRELFAAVLQSHLLGYGKPDPRFFTAIVNASGVAREQVMYVGDRLGTDVVAATAAGLRAAHVTPDGESRWARWLPPGAIRIRHVRDLLTLLPPTAGAVEGR